MEQILVKSDNVKPKPKQDAYSEELKRRAKELQEYKGEK